MTTQLRQVQRSVAMRNALDALDEIESRVGKIRELLGADPATAKDIAAEIVPLAVQIVKCASTLFWLSEMAKK